MELLMLYRLCKLFFVFLLYFYFLFVYITYTLIGMFLCLYYFIAHLFFSFLIIFDLVAKSTVVTSYFLVCEILNTCIEIFKLKVDLYPIQLRRKDMKI
jgi:hypothetical protein